jgi:hypothetical protein
MYYIAEQNKRNRNKKLITAILRLNLKLRRKIINKAKTAV